LKSYSREQWKAYKSDVLVRLRAEDVYSAIQGQRPSGDGWVMGKCPWHEDEHPSFAFNRQTLRWKCHAGCGEGDVFDYVMRVTRKRFREVVTEMGDKVGLPRSGGNEQQEERPAISESQVKGWQEALRKNDRALRWLHEKRGLSAATLEKYQIGWDAGRRRYTIPVRNEDGIVVNVRLYSSTDHPKILNYTNGEHKYGSPARLYGADELAKYEGGQVVVCEGEWDRLLLQQEGFMAVTSTHGCGVFPPHWKEWFNGKDAVILYDCDEEGKRAAEEVVLKALRTAGCASIRNVVLPLKGAKEEKDVTDWFICCGFSADQLRELIATSRVADVQEEATKVRAIEELEAKVAEHGLRAVDVAEAYLEHRGYRKEGMLTLYYWRGDWWKWDGRRYAKLATRELQADAMAFLGEVESTRAKASSRLQRDVVANLEGKCLLSDSVEQPSWLVEGEAQRAPDCVSMENGILDLTALLKGEGNCFKPHSPTFFSCVAVPYPFDPEADCPMWRKFLEEVLPNPEVRDLLREWFGYLLTYDTSQHRFVMFEGDGRNGKSVVCEVMRAVLGEDNVSAVPLEAFSDKFGLASTRGKLANIVEEIGQLDKPSEGHLKIFVGGGVMTLDRKYRDAVTVRATARLVFATNTRPRFADRSKGVWERLILIPFPVYIPEEKRDPILARKLCQELPGIFNWAVAGLFSLRKKGRFVEPRVCVEAKEDYRTEANPARAFLLERCDVCEGAEIEAAEVYSAYRRYCDDNGYKNPLGHAQFGKEVGRWFSEETGHDGLTLVQRRIGAERPRFYQGMRFSEGQEKGVTGGTGESVSLLHWANEK
jgi:putative DNA primase/helicase